MPKIAVPSLVIYGEADEFIPVEAYSDIQQWFLQPARIVKLANGGHFLHSRMAEQLNLSIDNWLGEVRQNR